MVAKRDQARPIALGIALAAVCVLGTYLRLNSYESSFYGDEFFTQKEIATAGTLSRALRNVAFGAEVSPPLYFALSWIAHQAVGTLESLRIPSLIAGVASIPVAFGLATKLAGRHVGIVAALLVAVSPWAIYYSGEARPYALLALFGALVPLCAIAAVEKRTLGRWLALSIVAGLALQTHLTAVFVVATTFGWLILVFPGLRIRVLVFAGIALAIELPWLPFLTGKGNLYMYGHFWGRGLLWFLTGLGHLTVSAPYTPIGQVPGWELATLAIVAVVISAATWVRKLPTPNSPAAITILCACATPVGLCVYSALTNVNLVSARNFSASGIAIVALIALALVRARPVWLATIATSTAVAVLALASIQAQRPEWGRPNIKGAAKILNETAPTGTLVTSPGGWEIGVYLRRDMKFREPGGYSDRGWDRAAAHRRALAFAIPNWGPLAGEDRSHETDLPNRWAGKFKLACARSLDGMFPVIVKLYVFKASRDVLRKRCSGDPHEPVASPPPDARKKIVILAAGNGHHILPQDSPREIGDWLVPLIGLVGAATFVATVLSRRRR